MSDIKLFLLHLDDHIRTILAETTEQNGDVLLSMGGVQPEKGNEKLYVLREVFSGNVLAAKNMKSEAASESFAVRPFNLYRCVRKSCGLMGCEWSQSIRGQPINPLA